MLSGATKLQQSRAQSCLPETNPIRSVEPAKMPVIALFQPMQTQKRELAREMRRLRHGRPRACRPNDLVVKTSPTLLFSQWSGMLRTPRAIRCFSTFRISRPSTINTHKNVSKVQDVAHLRGGSKHHIQSERRGGRKQHKTNFE